MITTLTGKNSFNLSLELANFTKDAQKELGDIGVEKFDASETEFDVILQSVQSLPFLAPRKLVVIQNAQSNSALLERVEELIDRVPNEVDVLLVGPVFDKRKASYNVLKKQTKVLEFPELRTDDLVPWVIKKAKDKGLNIRSADANYLVERVGTNQLVLASEIEKIGLSTKNIDRETIDMLTDRSVQSTVFSLLDAAFAGDSKKAIELYREQRRNRVDPHYILAMLSWQLNSLALAVFAEPQIERTLVGAGVSPFSARKSLSLARHINKTDMRNMILVLSDLDEKMKTTSDSDAALELYLLGLGR